MKYLSSIVQGAKCVVRGAKFLVTCSLAMGGKFGGMVVWCLRNEAATQWGVNVVLCTKVYMLLFGGYNSAME